MLLHTVACCCRLLSAALPCLLLNAKQQMLLGVQLLQLLKHLMYCESCIIATGKRYAHINMLRLRLCTCSQLCRHLLGQRAVQLRQCNVDSTGVAATAELLLPPRMTDTDGLHSIMLLNLGLQLLDTCWLPDYDRLIARKVACGRRCII